MVPSSIFIRCKGTPLASTKFKYVLLSIKDVPLLSRCGMVYLGLAPQKGGREVTVIALLDVVAA